MIGTFDAATSRSFIGASAKVLDLNGSPLHYRDITQQALSQGLIQSEGKIPEATLNAVICVDNLIGQLLEAMNYQNVVVTAPSNDKGVDVVADIELGITSVREVVQ
jgi:HB1, ASXL, restriction endonuclease HTH domain/Restriction endonuclease